jgi:hypothetical protein
MSAVAACRATILPARVQSRKVLSKLNAARSVPARAFRGASPVVMVARVEKPDDVWRKEVSGYQHGEERIAAPPHRTRRPRPRGPSRCAYHRRRSPRRSSERDSGTRHLPRNLVSPVYMSPTLPGFLGKWTSATAAPVHLVRVAPGDVGVPSLTGRLTTAPLTLDSPPASILVFAKNITVNRWVCVYEFSIS